MIDMPVLVGVDRSEESKKTLRWAAEYAGMSGASLNAVIARDLPTSYGIPALKTTSTFSHKHAPP